MCSTPILRPINAYSTPLSTPLGGADNAGDTDLLLEEIEDMEFTQPSKAHCFAHNQGESFNQEELFNQREPIDTPDDISLQNVTHRHQAKAPASAEPTRQSARIAESTKSNKHSDEYYPQFGEQKYSKINDKGDYVTAGKSASAASPLTANIMTPVEGTPKSHIHMITVLTMLTAGADNADTDEQSTLMFSIIGFAKLLNRVISTSNMYLQKRWQLTGLPNHYRYRHFKPFFTSSACQT